MKYVNIPIPEEYLDTVAGVMAGAGEACPRHGDRCKKVLVALDSCQLELLKLVELVIHGEVRIDIADGRPTDVHYWLDADGIQARQDFRTSKDGMNKARQLIELFRTANSFDVK